jgi:hypothetical protein
MYSVVSDNSFDQSPEPDLSPQSAASPHTLNFQFLLGDSTGVRLGLIILERQISVDGRDRYPGLLPKEIQTIFDAR